MSNWIEVNGVLLSKAKLTAIIKSEEKEIRVYLKNTPPLTFSYPEEESRNIRYGEFKAALMPETQETA